MKIIIGTTSELTTTQVKEYDFGVIEFPILMNGKEYDQNFFMSDRQDQIEQFIDMLKNKENHCSTVGISEKQFIDAFETYKDEEIIMILESLESTHATRDAVHKVVREHPEYDVKVFDSMSLTSGEGVQLIALMNEIKGKDVSRDDAFAILEKNRSNTYVSGLLYDLFFLNRNGRIGLAKAVLGTAMGLNPLLSSEPETGVIKSIGKVKNFKQANSRFLSSIKGQMQEKDSRKLTVLMAYVTKHEKECLHLKKLLETAAAENGWELDITINYAGFSLLPHLGPDFYNLGYIIGT